FTTAPSTGYEFSTRFDYSYQKFKGKLIFKRKNKKRNTREEQQGVPVIVTKEKNELRFGASMNVTPQFEIQTRLQSSFCKEGKGNWEKGTLFMNTFSYDSKRIPLSLRTRLAIFNTNSHNTALYAYEHDVLYAFSVPAYSGQGIRTYFLIKYEMSSSLSCWLRWGEWFYYDRKKVGSGLNEISGNSKNEMKLQIRYKF
ncbi:MAG: hypothetical protein ABEH43_03685, partial [Flavobacteriales bacterium]